jgi:hypothetical protein
MLEIACIEYLRDPIADVLRQAALEIAFNNPTR